MDIILLFLVKPLDKHGTTRVHITYLPLKNQVKCKTKYLSWAAIMYEFGQNSEHFFARFDTLNLD